MSWMAQKQLTFLQLFIFPSFLSFLSKQQAPMLPCLGCSADCNCSCMCVCVCVCVSLTRAKDWGLAGERWKAPQLQWLTLGCEVWLGFTSHPVHAQQRLFNVCVSHTHTLRDGVAPPPTSEPSCFAVHNCSSSQVCTVSIAAIVDDCDAVDFQLRSEHCNFWFCLCFF